MAEQIVRELIGGEWVTTYENAAGGSQIFEILRLPVTYDMADLLTGVPLYTPDPGEALSVLGYLSITDPWVTTDVNLGFLNIVSEGDDPDTGAIYGMQVNSGGSPSNVDSPVGSHAKSPRVQPVGNTITSYTDANPVVLIATDGSGGDPGFTAGAGELVIVWLKV